MRIREELAQWSKFLAWMSPGTRLKIHHHALPEPFRTILYRFLKQNVAGKQAGTRRWKIILPRESSREWTIEIQEPPVSPFSQLTVRVLDIFIATLTFVGMSPLFAVAWWHCWFRMRPASSLFLQVRCGYALRPILVPKLRTMRACPSWTFPLTVPGDPRIIPDLLWIRRTHLDELPQLLLVISGEWRLVGPRPELYSSLQRLSVFFPQGWWIATARPGLLSAGILHYRGAYLLHHLLRRARLYLSELEWTHAPALFTGRTLLAGLRFILGNFWKKNRHP